MSEKKKTGKVGRPGDPRIKRLTNQVEKLKKQLNDLTDSTVDNLLDNLNLTNWCVGISVKVVERNGELRNQYFLDAFKYDLEKGVAKKVESIDAGDAEHRAAFELKKFIERYVMENVR